MAQVCVKAYTRSDGTKVKGYCYSRGVSSSKLTDERAKRSGLRHANKFKKKGETRLRSIRAERNAKRILSNKKGTGFSRASKILTESGNLTKALSVTQRRLKKRFKRKGLTKKQSKNLLDVFRKQRVKNYKK